MGWMDNDGLRHLWGVITQKFYKKTEVDQLIKGVTGEVPLYEDFTGATSSTSGTHGLVPAPNAGNQEKFLKGDGTWGTPTDTTYSVATQSKDGLMSSSDKIKIDNMDSTYAKKSDISGIYKYKGSVASEALLPSGSQSVGDVYNIETTSQYGAAGANVAWNGTAWDSLGEIFTVTAMSNSEIDDICV